ncbi:50S ribosomal protein L4 [Candidatus Shapirobacteria bacterium CG10_big_fil_rev_8_21_14_0_10_40_9]|uniref:Large ribosomal subunit protein uL4 n=1 Tax=Candidatus Shapirobacteria bacterium CG10_big_fil_rev_8_21_14_0_10_40_9 TaxID=1974888 RepID=A0A2M8L389_9BACT|nr:MAG: 50S ribosomal protein L4 [Candidatus Shapirobacteria bacterium CG10_big_fil_rev_8_21_14_0_10_40_9]
MIYAEVISLSGTKKPKISLPAKIFGAKPNPALMAQAVRVFLSNQREARAKTKTRSEVKRSKAKWYRQKGTGRARHGARSAPIFVGGGRAHGPTGEQNYEKAMPKKMGRAALISALSSRARDKEIIIVDGLEKIKKTKEMAKILKEVTGPFLLILSGKLENVILATRNIPSLALIQAKSLNAYEVLKAGKILITREAIKTLEAKWTKD